MRFQVLIRVTTLLLLGYTAIYVYTQTHYWLVSFWIGLLVLFLVYELIKFIERSDRELVKFLDAIRQNDFSIHYKSVKPTAESNRFQYILKEISAALGRLSREKEINHLYLHTVVEHIDIALICFDKSGKVILFNTAAKNLIYKPGLHNINLLKEIAPDLFEEINSVKPEKPTIFKFTLKGIKNTFSLQKSLFYLNEQEYNLVSLKDIGSELEEQEIESWQNLIRVLTHEIMNSVIPITNLSEVVKEMVVEKVPSEDSSISFSAEESIDLKESLDTILKRTKGLSHFVSAYRQMAYLPQPNRQKVDINEIIDRVVKLLKPGLATKKIEIEVEKLRQPVYLNIDSDLIEQVLINLIKNAADAVEDTKNGKITIEASLAIGKALVIIKDNGPPIPPEVLEQIFIPFFTTKARGSGIGLSLSRQIMRLHGGSIKVQSATGKEKSFILEF
jgi:two-component system, NtrC family, nitrogen regulation sensor histidine kinase NtrY